MRFSTIAALSPRLALRRLVTTSGSSIATVLTLGVGVAAVSFVSAIAYGVLLRPLPYPRAAELVSLGTIDVAGRSGGVSLPDVTDWREQGTSFQAIGTFIEQRAAIATPAGTLPVQVAAVDHQFFDVLGIPAAAGRTITIADEHAPVIVLAWSTWQQLFASSPSAIGSTIRVNGETATVIGVAGPDFTLAAGDVAAWTPLEYVRQTAPPQWNMRGFRGFQSIGRLKPKTTIPTATADLEQIASRLAAEYPRFNEGVRISIGSLTQTRVAPVRQILELLWISAVVLLLITCGNTASLSSVQAIRRRHEWAIRIALGARGWQIAAETLMDVMLLGAAGTVTGLVLGSVLIGWFETHHPERFPSLEAVRMDLPVILATALLGLVAAALSALVPAWRALHSDAGETLKETRAAGFKSRRTQRWLAAGQTALSVTLVLATALVARHLWTELTADLGTANTSILTARVDLTAPRYAKAGAQRQFIARLSDTLALKATTPVGLISSLPPATGQMRTTLKPAGDPLAAEILVDIVSTTPATFDVLGMRIVEGRGISDADSADSAPVAVLSAAAARLLFPGRDALGRRVPFGGPGTQPLVIGVVGDIRFRGLNVPAGAAMYLPAAQRSFRTMYVVMNSALGYDATSRALQEAVKATDPDVALAQIATLQALRASAASADTFKAITVGTITASAIFLALIGVYGVSSQSAALRRKEFAVRIALGSSRAAISRLILAEAMRVCLIGAAAGMTLGVVAYRVGNAHIGGVPQVNITTVAIAAMAALFIAIAASSIPALKAALGNPSEALRS